MFRDQPKNLVQFDGEKRSSIRTFQSNPQKQQFSIGWDVAPKSDTLTSKVGQQSNQFVPKYQASNMTPPTYKENILASNGNQVASYGNYNDYANGMGKAQQSIKASYPSYQDDEGPVSQAGGPYYDDVCQQNQPKGPDDGYGYAPSYQAPISEQRIDGANDFRRQNAARNQTSNIFNSDLMANEREFTGESRRGPLKKRNEDVQTKGYGSFYQQNGMGQYVGVPRTTQQPRSQQSSSNSVFGY